MKTLLTSTLVAVSLAAAALPGAALARDGRNGAAAAGAAAGLVGGAILGSQLNRHNDDSYGDAPPPRYVERDCYWQRQRVWDGDGYEIQRVRVCNR